MIEQLIQRVFETRNAAHIAHWKETSGFRHETLGEFYVDVIDALDAIVEAHQGVFELVKVPALAKQEAVPDSVVPWLEDDLVWIGKNRSALCNGLPAIDNLIQGLEDVYIKTLYKLKRLK